MPILYGAIQDLPSIRHDISPGVLFHGFDFEPGTFQYGVVSSSCVCWVFYGFYWFLPQFENMCEK